METKIVRSSSINCYKFCPWQYFLTYVLGMETRSGKAAMQGTIVHLVLQWMSEIKKRNIKYTNYRHMLEKAWNHVVKQNPGINIRRTTSRGDAADYLKCLNSIESVLDSRLSPIKLKILYSEKKFNLPLPGREDIILSGTIDLLHEIDSSTIEIIDYKTGKRKDWATTKDKDFYDLIKDVQPRIYHLASFLLFPEYKNVMVTFNYINDGGVFTIPLTIDDLPYTIASILKFVNTVEKDNDIYRNRTWKCNNFCQFGKNNICNISWDHRFKYGIESVRQKFTKLTINQQDAINV